MTSKSSGRLPAAFLDELRNRLTLSTVVGRRVKLARAGREFKACCPFHNEKTASFYVNDDKNFFHCFGCGAHGDVLSFVMRTEGADFMDAVERLASEAGLAVPRPSPSDAAAHDARTRIYDCLERAACIFAAALAGSPAEAYARGERRLAAAEIALWRIGFAGGDVPIAALRREGFDDATLHAAGLLARREDGTGYAFFRNRLVFPIADPRGRVRGFGARALGDAKPKYLNSPAGEIFDKGQLVFGAHVARARRELPPPALVVGEGYLDAIALTGLGLRGVATNGTALTEGHLEALWRLDPEPVVAFDGDAAGIAAMKRAVERALPLVAGERRLRFARMPAGEDPDSARAHGRGDAVLRAVEEAMPLSRALYAVCADGLDLDQPEMRALCESRLRERIDRIADAPTRSAFESALIWQGVRRLRVVDGGRKAAVRAPRLAAPDAGDLGRRAVERMQRALVRCVLAGGPVVDQLVEEISSLGPEIPGLDAALGDPAAYAASDAGTALLGDTVLARDFACLRPDCGPIETERFLRYAFDFFAARRLADELAQTSPSADDAAGLDAFLAKAAELGALRERIAIGFEE